jgi:hypothetical protein
MAIGQVIENDNLWKKFSVRKRQLCLKAAENAFEIFGAFPGTLFVYFLIF